MKLQSIKRKLHYWKEHPPSDEELGNAISDEKIKLVSIREEHIKKKQKKTDNDKKEKPKKEPSEKKSGKIEYSSVETLYLMQKNKLELFLNSKPLEISTLLKKLFL